MPVRGRRRQARRSEGKDASRRERPSGYGTRAARLEPTYLAGTLAFMFESRHVFRATRFALETSARQSDYLKVWQTLEKHFTGK